MTKLEKIKITLLRRECETLGKNMNKTILALRECEALVYKYDEKLYNINVSSTKYVRSTTRIGDFWVGQKLVSKETLWSKSHDIGFSPSILLIKYKEYEVIQVNDYGGINKKYSIATTSEFDGARDGVANWDIEDGDDYKFPFYTIQELRDHKLEILKIK